MLPSKPYDVAPRCCFLALRYTPPPAKNTRNKKTWKLTVTPFRREPNPPPQARTHPSHSQHTLASPYCVGLFMHTGNENQPRSDGPPNQGGVAYRTRVVAQQHTRTSLQRASERVDDCVEGHNNRPTVGLHHGQPQSLPPPTNRCCFATPLHPACVPPTPLSGLKTTTLVRKCHEMPPSTNSNNRRF